LFAYPYLDELGQRALVERRADLGELLRRPGSAIQVDDDGAHFWTFAGGRINHTVKYALEWIGGWKAVADNFQLRIEGDGVTHTTVDNAIRRMFEPGFWDDPETAAPSRPAFLNIAPASSNGHCQTTPPLKWWAGIYWIYLQHKNGYKVKWHSGSNSQ
jgi:hypothetical protein